MVTKSGKWVYAKNVNEQVNPNATKRNHWSNTANAVGHTTKSTSAKFTKDKYTTKENNKTVTKYKKNHPYTLTAHNFGLSRPNEAYINEITFEVKIKVSNNIGVEYPRCLFTIYGRGWDNKITDSKKMETGWYNGLYMVNPSKKVPTSFKIIS